jgi:hypothetical protein
MGPACIERKIDMTIIYEAITIANGASLSGKIRISDSLLCGIVMSDGWDAADITFQASRDDVTYNDVYDDAGDEKTVTVAADRHVVLEPSGFAGMSWIKLRSGTSGTPVAQSAARTLYLVLRPAE